MQLFLFIFYFALTSYILYRLKLHRDTGISSAVLLLLFALKIGAGVLNLYLHNNVFTNSDAAFYHWQSMEELKVAGQHPIAFLQEWLFNWGDISGRINFLQRENTPYWSNLGSLFHGKFMTLSNLLSFGHIYVNVIFYNVFFFIGQVFLYKTFFTLRPDKKELLIFSIFLIPSILFWCSGIHKDGWILAALGCLTFATLKIHYKFKPRYVFIILSSLFFILIIRYFYFICILPAYLLWIFTKDNPKRVPIYLMCYALFALAFLCYGYLDPTHNPMWLIINKQKDFLALNGISDFHLNELEPTVSSFLQNLPQAIYHILIMPIFKLEAPLRYQMASLDSLFVAGLILLTVIHIKRSNLNSSFYLFGVFFSITVYLFIGYTIPNSGALVRYKSEFTALLLPSLICLSEIPLLNILVEKVKNWTKSILLK